MVVVMKKLKWICPACGSTEMVMVKRNVTMITPIDGIEVGELCYNKLDEHAISVDQRCNFECAECDHIVLSDTRDAADLVDLIKKNKWF